LYPTSSLKNDTTGFSEQNDSRQFASVYEMAFASLLKALDGERKESLDVMRSFITKVQKPHRSDLMRSTTLNFLSQLYLRWNLRRYSIQGNGAFLTFPANNGETSPENFIWHNP
jgi:hypothetical protein